MFYFDAGLFVKKLNEAPAREKDPDENLKKIVMMVLADEIDFALFTFEELNKVLEHVSVYGGSHSTDLKNLLVKMERPAILSETLGSLKRRRIGYALV